MKQRGAVPGIMCLISLIFIFVIIPAQTKRLQVPGDLEPSVFPTAAMAVIAALSGVLFIQERRKTADKKYFCKGDLKCLCAAGALLAVYIFMLNLVGYYVATAAAMVLALRKYDRMRWRVCLVSTALFLLACYVLFEVGLRISLPRGFLL